MGGTKLQPQVIAALLTAGVTEEMIAGARQILGACTIRTVGRPRKYKNRAECDRAYKLRKKEREKTRKKILDALSLEEATPDAHALSLKEVKAIPATARDEIRDEIPRFVIEARQRLLLDAAQGHVDPAADIAPIQALLDQGCNFEMDVLPTVARTVPELPRPLKNWGAQWLVRGIPAAREQRLNRFADSVKGGAALRRSDTEPRPADAPASTSLPASRRPRDRQALIDKAEDRAASMRRARRVRRTPRKRGT
jgi:hypothetical protein